MDLFRAERRRILAEGNEAAARANGLDESGDERDHDSSWDYLRARHEAADRYRELLPDVQVSRCPFTGEPLTWAMDTVDLDGWFWEYEAPVRRARDYLPGTFLALTGAMRINQPVTWAPFAVEPGPGVPYVVPRILNQPETLAVVAQIPVGKHVGWPITYFGPRRTGIKLENDWGSGKFDVYDHDGTWLGWDEKPPAVRHYDFELEPWVSSGKLRWIAPGDETMTLRQGVDGCPYLGIEGPRELAFVEEGKVRYF
jgi:hypothetical protein